MNKCQNCQTEYDGDVCPTCQKNEETKPEVKPETNQETNPENKSFKDKVRGFIDKYYTKLKLVPFITYIAYMVLSALFLFACPVAVVKVAGVKYGSVFSAKSFNEIPGLNNVATALRIVAILALIYTLMYTIYRFVSLRYARVGKVRVSFILEIVSAVLVFAFFVFACIIAGVINTADKGIDLVSVGAYSILTIILSIFALILIISTVVVCYLYEKQHPELEEEFDKQYEIAKEKEKKRKKKEISTRQKITGVVAGIVCIIAIFICLGDSGIFEFEKSFNAKKLQSIALADNGELKITKSTLVKKIGDSYLEIDEEADNTYSTYYTSNYVSLKRKKERLSKYSEKASLEKMLEWADYEMQLYMDEANMTYGEANITFDKYQGVESIIYTINSPKSTSRKLINTKVMKVVEKNADNGKKSIDYIVFMGTYSDGSFVYAKVNGIYVNVKLVDGNLENEYEGSYKDYELVWYNSDGLGKNSYSYGTTTSSYHLDCSASETYAYNDETHWKECVYEGCTEKVEEEAHSYTNGVCECGKEEV